MTPAISRDENSVADIRVLRVAGMLAVAVALSGCFVEQMFLGWSSKTMVHPETNDRQKCEGYFGKAEECVRLWESKGYYELGRWPPR
jgi:hypothetical protein